MSSIKKTFFSDERIIPFTHFPYDYNLFEIKKGGFIKKNKPIYNFLVSENNTIIPDHSGNHIEIYKSEDDVFFQYQKEEIIEGNVIYIHNCSHYLHFIAETISSLIIYKELGVFNQYLPDNSKILVLTGGKLDLKKIELFLNIDLSKYEIIYGERDVLYRASKILVNTTTTQVAGTILPHYATKYLYNTFKNKYEIKKGKCIFVSRRDAKYRFLLNEREILEYFQNKGINLDIFIGSNLSIEEQIKEFNTAETIITISGTHGINLLYSNPMVKKIIVLSPQYITGQYKQIFHCLNLPIDIVYAYDEETVELNGKLLHVANNNFKVDPELIYKKFYE